MASRGLIDKGKAQGVDNLIISMDKRKLQFDQAEVGWSKVSPEKAADDLYDDAVSVISAADVLLDQYKRGVIATGAGGALGGGLLAAGGYGPSGFGKAVDPAVEDLLGDYETASQVFNQPTRHPLKPRQRLGVLAAGMVARRAADELVPGFKQGRRMLRTGRKLRDAFLDVTAPQPATPKVIMPPRYGKQLIHDSEFNAIGTTRYEYMRMSSGEQRQIRLQIQALRDKAPPSRLARAVEARSNAAVSSSWKWRRDAQVAAARDALRTGRPKIELPIGSSFQERMRLKNAGAMDAQEFTDAVKRLQQAEAKEGIGSSVSSALISAHPDKWIGKSYSKSAPHIDRLVQLANSGLPEPEFGKSLSSLVRAGRQALTRFKRPPDDELMAPPSAWRGAIKPYDPIRANPAERVPLPAPGDMGTYLRRAGDRVMSAAALRQRIFNLGRDARALMQSGGGDARQVQNLQSRYRALRIAEGGQGGPAPNADKLAAQYPQFFSVIGKAVGTALREGLKRFGGKVMDSPAGKIVGQKANIAVGAAGAVAGGILGTAALVALKRQAAALVARREALRAAAKAPDSVYQEASRRGATSIHDPVYRRAVGATFREQAGVGVLTSRRQLRMAGRMMGGGMFGGAAGAAVGGISATPVGVAAGAVQGASAGALVGLARHGQKEIANALRETNRRIADINRKIAAEEAKIQSAKREAAARARQEKMQIAESRRRDKAQIGRLRAAANVAGGRLSQQRAMVTQSTTDLRTSRLLLDDMLGPAKQRHQRIMGRQQRELDEVMGAVNRKFGSKPKRRLPNIFRRTEKAANVIPFAKFANPAKYQASRLRAPGVPKSLRAAGRWLGLAAKTVFTGPGAVLLNADIAQDAFYARKTGLHQLKRYRDIVRMQAGPAALSAFNRLSAVDQGRLARHYWDNDQTHHDEIMDLAGGGVALTTTASGFRPKLVSVR